MSTASSEEKGGFIEKVKDFIQDIGEKIEEAVGFGKPTADVTAIHIPSINLDKADIVVDVLVTNPNPLPIPLVDINYLVESDGRKLVSGLIPDAGTIRAHGSETVKIPLTLVYDDIKNTYDDIHPGSIIPYRIKVDLIVDVPVFGRLTLPLEKTGEIPIPYKPDVDLEKIRFKAFSFEETVALLHLKLENMNDFDLGLNALESEIWLYGVSIGGAQIAQSTKIGKQGNTIPITFRPKDLGSAVWEMIRGKGTGYSIKGNIDVDTPFGAMKLPITKEGGTTKLKKNKEDRDDEDDEMLLSRDTMTIIQPETPLTFTRRLVGGVSIDTDQGRSSVATSGRIAYPCGPMRALYDNSAVAHGDSIKFHLGTCLCGTIYTAPVLGIVFAADTRIARTIGDTLCGTWDDFQKWEMFHDCYVLFTGNAVTAKVIQNYLYSWEDMHGPAEVMPPYKVTDMIRQQMHDIGHYGAAIVCSFAGEFPFIRILLTGHPMEATGLDDTFFVAGSMGNALPAVYRTPEYWHDLNYLQAERKVLEVMIKAHLVDAMHCGPFIHLHHLRQRRHGFEQIDLNEFTALRYIRGSNSGPLFPYFSRGRDLVGPS